MNEETAIITDKIQQTSILNTENEFSVAYTCNTDSIHDFTQRKNKTTLKSTFNCILNISIAIPTLVFHISIITFICTILNIIPISTSLRRRL